MTYDHMSEEYLMPKGLRPKPNKWLTGVYLFLNLLGIVVIIIIASFKN